MIFCSQHKVNMVRPDMAAGADAEPIYRMWVCPENREERVADADLMRTLGGIEGVSFVTYTRLDDGSVRLRGHA